MRIALYDGLHDLGHRTWYSEPLGAALADLGHEVLVLRPPGSRRSDNDGLSRVAVPASGPGVPVRPFFRELPRMRRSLRAAEAAAVSFSADVFVELELDQRFWVLARPARHFDRVGVLHSAEQLLNRFGRKHVLRPVVRAARRAAFGRALARSDLVVCFRPEVAAEVRAFRPDTPTAVIPFPLVYRHDLEPSDVDERTVGGDEPFTVLVAGEVRPDKCLDRLIDALRDFEAPTVVEVIGKQGRSLDLPETIGPHRVVVDDRFVPEAEIAAAHRRADLVFAPIPQEFAYGSRTRGSLVKSAAYGAPVLTTSVGLGQLPKGFGVVVADDDVSAAGVGRALADAVARRSELREASRRTGPPFAAASHTFEAFAIGLADALHARRATSI